MPVTNKIILGTVQFGLEYGINNQHGKPSHKTVTAILDLAYNNGIHLLDTAEAYGDSQEVIGQYHRQSANRFEIITKFNSKLSSAPQSIEKRIEQNLKTLGVRTLYAYMFHSYQDFEQLFAQYRSEINKCKQKGLFKKFGVSIYTNEEFEKLLGYDEVDLVQLPFNLLDNNFQRAKLIQRAKEKGMEVHTRSVFLQGLFFKNLESLPAKLQRLNPYLEILLRLSKHYGVSMSDMALNYALLQDQIDAVLIGVETVTQLEENLRAMKHGLAHDVIKHIDSVQVQEKELLNPSTWNA